MANNLKGYDFPQVLRSVFDVDKNCLRVCIVDGSGSGDPLEIVIDHTTDSIRLGDGTNLFTGTVLGSKVGLDINLLNSPEVTTPIVTNITVGTPNTQLSHTFNTGTKKYLIRTRNGGKVNFSFVSGQTGTNYITLMSGSSYMEDNIKNTGSLTIYFQVNKADVVEILEWA